MSRNMTKPTKWVCAQRRQISLGIRPVWSESLLCAQWVAKDPSFLHADSEDSDQTRRMPRLIWVFAGRTVTLLVLSCRGSNVQKTASTVKEHKSDFLCMPQILGQLLESGSTMGTVGNDLKLWLQKYKKKPNVVIIWAASWQNQNDRALSEDSDQPGHPPSLIRVFAVCMKKHWVLSYPLSVQRRLWSNWADSQADLSLR